MMSKRIYVCDKITMQVLREYDSAQQAQLDLRIRVNQEARKRSVRHGRCVFRYADDYDANESFEGKYNRPVKCTHIESGMTATFYNLKSAAKAAGRDTTTIVKRIKNGNTFDGRRWEYAR